MHLGVEAGDSSPGLEAPASWDRPSTRLKRTMPIDERRKYQAVWPRRPGSGRWLDGGVDRQMPYQKSVKPGPAKRRPWFAGVGCSGRSLADVVERSARLLRLRRRGHCRRDWRCSSPATPRRAMNGSTSAIYPGVRWDCAVGRGCVTAARFVGQNECSRLLLTKARRGRSVTWSGLAPAAGVFPSRLSRLDSSRSPSARRRPDVTSRPDCAQIPRRPRRLHSPPV